MADFVDRESPVPLYRQIKAILLDEIDGGVRITSGAPWTERELTSRFHVSAAPVRQALKELADEGYLYRERSKGTFPLRGVDVKPPGLQLGNLVSYLEGRGFDLESTVLGARRVRAPELVQTKLGLSHADYVFMLSRLIALKQRPMIYGLMYLRTPADFNPTLRDLEGESGIFALLDRDPDLALVHGEHTIWAEEASREDAELLDIAEHDPVMVMETLMYTRSGNLGGFRRLLHRADEYKLNFSVTDRSS